MRKETESKLVLMVLSALFTAVISVVSQISFLTPIGVPITFQVFAIALCGYFLGVKWGSGAVLVYIITGLVGLPVFSGFRGGIQCLFELTGGFITGFIFLVFFCGLAKKSKKLNKQIFLGLSGLLLCHLCGITQFAVISRTGFLEGLITVSLPYFIKDVILVVMSAVLGGYLKNIIKKYVKK